MTVRQTANGRDQLLSTIHLDMSDNQQTAAATTSMPPKPLHCIKQQQQQQEGQGKGSRHVASRAPGTFISYLTY